MPAVCYWWNIRLPLFLILSSNIDSDIAWVCWCEQLVSQVHECPPFDTTDDVSRQKNRRSKFSLQSSVEMSAQKYDTLAPLHITARIG